MEEEVVEALTSSCINLQAWMGGRCPFSCGVGRWWEDVMAIFSQLGWQSLVNCTLGLV